MHIHSLYRRMYSCTDKRGEARCEPSMGFTLAGGRRLAASLGQIDGKVAKCCSAVEESVVEVEPTPVPRPGSQGPLPAPGWPGLERPGSVFAPGMHEPLGLRPRRDGWDWSGRFAALAPRLRRGRRTVIRAGMAGNAPAAATPAPGGGLRVSHANEFARIHDPSLLNR